MGGYVIWPPIKRVQAAWVVIEVVIEIPIHVTIENSIPSGNVQQQEA